MNTSEPQAAIRRKLLAAARLAKPARARPRQAKNGRALPSAWFLTDPDRTKNLLAVIARLPRGWGVIYRHFGAGERFTVGAALARACRLRGLILLVSADPALAAAIGAIQVLGRLLLFFFERHFDLHLANRLIPALIPLGLLALIAAPWMEATHGALVLLFVLVWGVGNGMLPIVTGTAIAQYVDRDHVASLNGALGIPTALARASADHDSARTATSPRARNPSAA